MVVTAWGELRGMELGLASEAGISGGKRAALVCLTVLRGVTTAEDVGTAWNRITPGGSVKSWWPAASVEVAGVSMVRGMLAAEVIGTRPWAAVPLLAPALLIGISA